MKQTKIVQELRAFLDTSGVTASRLAEVSGVSSTTISYLRNGKRRDCASETADCLREGMAKLNAQATPEKK